MTTALKLMAVLAHPDDESLGTGGILAKYAAEGIKTSLVTGTRGDLGWFGTHQDYRGAYVLGIRREEELLAAAEVLGIRYVDFLNYIDGDVDQAHPAEIIAKIVGHIRHVQPDVVVTFGPDGIYGHPDHVAISQFTTAAVLEAASASSLYYQNLAPHSVSKFYYMVATRGLLDVYQTVFGNVAMEIDDKERRGVAWPEWAVTTQIDVERYWPTVWEAISCHRTQFPLHAAMENILAHLSEQQRMELYGTQHYYRVLSRVNGGRRVERDLFEGLR